MPLGFWLEDIRSFKKPHPPRPIYLRYYYYPLFNSYSFDVPIVFKTNAPLVAFRNALKSDRIVLGCHKFLRTFTVAGCMNGGCAE